MDELLKWQRFAANRYESARGAFDKGWFQSAADWQYLAKAAFQKVLMANFNADGTRKEEPKKVEQDVWTKSPSNPRVEINQHGIYRTVDFTPSSPYSPPVASPVQPDEYYGYEGWGLHE